jgi:uroporphyrin-3 C-methyltransferase
MCRMSQDDTASTGAASSGERPQTPPSAGRKKPGPQRGGSVAFALLLSIVAVGGAGYIGWRQWQQERMAGQDNQTLANVQQRVGGMQQSLTALDSDRTALRQRLSDADQVNRGLREELLGQAERVRNLEDAVAKLSEKTLSGHDAMLLDETESLLRLGKERYDLFHDAQGAATAYAAADQSLAAVNDGAFSGLRQSVAAEHEALVKSQPASRTAALDTLTQLRADVANLPLKALDAPTDADTGTWARVRRALSSVISIRRDNGAPLAVADARFARELASLDLAQAQLSLMAYDRDAYQAALQRVTATLGAQFDTGTPGVQQAQAQLAALSSQLPPTSTVQLGAALTELRNLRSVHALKPANDNATPAHAVSGAKP